MKRLSTPLVCGGTACVHVYICACLVASVHVWVRAQQVDGKLVIIPICRLTIINEIHCHPGGYLLLLV